MGKTPEQYILDNSWSGVTVDELASHHDIDHPTARQIIDQLTLAGVIYYCGDQYLNADGQQIWRHTHYDDGSGDWRCTYCGSGWHAGTTCPSLTP